MFVGNLHTFLERQLLDGVRFASSAGFIAFDVMACKVDAVARDDLARLDKRDVTHNYFLMGAEYDIQTKV